MNYKVTFYKDEMEMLTERKANFTHKLAKISSKIFKAIADKIGGKGTSGQKILKAMIKHVIANEKTNEKEDLKISVSIPDLINNLPQYGINNQIEVSVIFHNTSSTESKSTEINISGHAQISYEFGVKIVSGIQIKVDYELNPRKIDFKKDIELLVNEFNSILVHEIAHVYDDKIIDEIENHQETYTFSKSADYLNYFIKYSEIRSHLNEVIYNIKQARFKNTKKDSSSKNELVGINDNNYKYQTNLKTKEIIDTKSKKFLSQKIDRAFYSCSKNLKKFIIDYHIAFVRDNSQSDYERYYKVLFPNSNPPSFNQMKKFFDKIIFSYRIFNSLKINLKDVKDSISPFDYFVKTREITKWEDSVWDDEDYNECFKTYDYMGVMKISWEKFEEKKKQMELSTNK